MKIREDAIVSSAKFYFYPIIVANTAAMGLAVGVNLWRSLLFSLVLSCLSSFGFILNDLWDIAIDKVNRPQHFEELESSELTKARWACVSFISFALLLSFLLGWPEFGLALAVGLGLTAYTALLRRFLLVPNLLAALLASSPIWSPLVLWSNGAPDSRKLFFVIAIIGIITAREILMDTRDVVGDAVGGRTTFATLFNERIATFVGVVLTLSACVPFVLSIAAGVQQAPLAVLIATFAIGLSILYLLVPSVLRTVSMTRSRPEILVYVEKSRWAMTLIPVLVILLWYR